MKKRKLGNINFRCRWYVLANRTRAVIYAAPPGGRFIFVNRLINNKGRLAEKDLDSDRPGRAYSSASGGIIHHTLDRRSFRREQVAIKFARRIARVLASSSETKSYSELVLVAEPHFLGLLKKELPESVKSLVKYELKHEYLSGSDYELRDSVMKALAKESERSHRPQVS